jgi:hypothetical protein
MSAIILVHDNALEKKKTRSQRGRKERKERRREEGKKRTY